MVAFFPFVFVTVVPLVGCMVQPEEPEATIGLAEDDSDVVGKAEHTINILNALLPEALTAGGDLAKAPLSLDVMSPETREAIKEPSERGRLARMFLKYAVGCALEPGHGVSFSWNDLHGDVHNESYEGLAGLAPSWESAPLDEAGQQWVTACLGARTNRYGHEVEISMRGSADALAATDDAEIHEFMYEEGAFWGNLFASVPYLRTCHDPENVGRARRTERDCAAGLASDERADCGIMEIMGSCAEQCASLGEGLYETGCPALESGVPSGEKTEYVITVFLP